METVYSSGDITDRVIYQSGTGAKGHGQCERMLLWEVINLFLGDFVPPLDNKLLYLNRKLEKDTISLFKILLTTKLDQSWLDKEIRINREDDAASWLFNGVHHIYNRINIAKSREKEVVGTNSVPENISDGLDEVMDYKSGDVLVPDMDKHIFEDDYKEDVPEDDDDGFGTNSGRTRPCLLNLSTEGWREIDKLKVKKLQQHASDCIIRKRDVTKYIMMQVMEVKSKTRSIFICGENPIAEMSSWSAYLNELRPNY